MGDACDSEYGGGNSDTVADGIFFHALETDAFCINDTPGADDDGDGWCAVTSAGADPDDNDANVTGAKDQNADAHLFPGKPGHDYENYREIYMQTDPLADCAEVLLKHDAWPPDLNNDRFVNITDVNLLRDPVFNSEPPSIYYIPRYDLTAGTDPWDPIINILDVNLLRPPVFNLTVPCAPP